ncbi:GntR family transcriptional regulator [Heliobacterium gestii]|uniref:GntR family transcriptional regulator n=1 Tax=Heliomicrobium gestii TaxID=2699 RepID=A0A845L9V8_HELGE|nr:GntR family transcriptional regulator [Heliomicrobium gestii]MBM7865456.1 GntR family transcriptional regulator [Heliomicrobium gestii]MZP41710.1 GntR family transcriptional regulator [Heliomicrobium gestii]
MNTEHLGSRFQLDLSKPLYEQILYQIRHAVSRKEIALGEKIPSIREMAQQLKVNPNTVMRAYQELERDGLTETRRGQGTFITTSPEKINQVRKILAEDAIRGFIASMKDLGMDQASAKKMLEEVDWS